ncbi:MAG: hypothetical protein ABJA98_27480 [Acidobacteriota bacterium]
MSITIWTRLEPDTVPSAQGFDATVRDRLLSVGVQARVHDPLWLIGRQWQFGEFQGEDAGSPIQVDVRLESSPITAYLPSIPTSGSHVVGQKYARDPVSRAPVVALETLVEAERVRTGEQPNLRGVAEAGLRFVRALVDAGFVRYRGAFLKAFPFQPVADSSLDRASSLLQRIVAGRAVGAEALGQQLRINNPPGSTKPFVLPPTVGVSVADRALMATILKGWLEWYEAGLVTEPAAATPWTPERMEYRFAVAAPAMSGEQEAVLVAPSYGGDLDWPSFDRLNGSSGTSLGATGAAQVAQTLSLIPAKVRYPGMPSSRFWEFEDARVDLGAVAAQPGDLARLLLLEFSLVYGNDWFVVPIDIVTGSLARVAALEVVDTFGQRRTIPAASEGDAGRRSRLFRLSTRGAGPTSDALFVPPALGPSLESTAIEQVRFARDEVANIVWAIERAIESPVGRPLDLRRDQPAPPNPVGADGAAVQYQLMSTLPRNWLPLVPLDSISAPPVKLTLGAVLVEGVVQTPAPRGRIVSSDVSLAAEEVPRDGLDVTRIYRYARWVDGSTRVWAARRRRPASGEASSALRFDFLEER